MVTDLFIWTICYLSSIFLCEHHQNSLTRLTDAMQMQLSMVSLFMPHLQLHLDSARMRPVLRTGHWHGPLAFCSAHTTYATLSSIPFF